MLRSSLDGFKPHYSTSSLKRSIEEAQRGATKIQTEPVADQNPQEGDVLVFRDGQWVSGNDLGTAITLSENYS